MINAMREALLTGRPVASSIGNGPLKAVIGRVLRVEFEQAGATCTPDRHADRRACRIAWRSDLKDLPVRGMR